MKIALILRSLLISFKRIIKKPSIIILCIVIIASAFIFRTVESEDSEKSVILYYITGEEENDKQIINKAINNYEGYFVFEEVNSINEISRKVANQQAHMGYIIPSELFTLIKNGEDEDLIIKITDNASNLSYVCDEILYSLLFPEISKRNLADYLVNKSSLNETLEKNNIGYSEIFTLYDINHSNLEFPIEYIKVSDINDATTSSSDMAANIKPNNILSSSLRGIFAIIMNLSAIFGVLDYFRNQDKYIRNRLYMRIISIAVPVVITGICTFIGQLCSRQINNIPKELIVLCFYSLVLILVNVLISLIIKRTSVYFTLLPFYCMSVLIFTPVFFNIEAYIPFIKYTYIIFLPGIYLTLI